MRERLPFGRWMKQARARLDLTQEHVADRVGCATQTVRAFELGTRRPSRELAERLATVLQIAPDDRAEFIALARQIGKEDSDIQRGVESALPEIGAEVAPPTGVVLPRVVAPPIPLNVLIGREHEYRAIKAAIADPHKRLVTVLGQGGMGKTRLALQVAHDLYAQARDGAVWVPLATVVQHEELPRAIADALGGAGQKIASLQDYLVDYFRDGAAVLVLDNLEHLMDAIPFLASLLYHAPLLTIIVTSRERLRISGEWVVELGGLTVPVDDALDQNARSAAMLMFVERARQLSRHFAITPLNRSAIMRICRLVEGLPLGIELAASWIRILDVNEIADEIARSLDFLELAERGMPARHQSLRAVFEQSWRFLDAEEQHVLAQLSVFQGGFDRTAAQTVAGAALSMLASLHDKSLIRRNANHRYDLHPLVQQYARTKLDADPTTAAATEERFSHYYADYAVREYDDLLSKDEVVSHLRLTAELPNIRAAWLWSVEQHRWDDIDRIAETLARYFELRDGHPESDRLFSEAVSMLGIPRVDDVHASDAEKRVVGRLMANAAAAQIRQGTLTKLDRPRFDTAQALLHTVDDGRGLANIYQSMGIIAFHQGHYDAAITACSTALAYAEREDYGWFISGTELSIGLFEQVRGASDTALLWNRRALDSTSRLGSMYLIQAAMVNTANVLGSMGAYDEALTYIHQSIALSEDPWAHATMLRERGNILRAQGKNNEAITLFEQSLHLLHAIRNRWDWMRTLNIAGDAYLDIGQPDLAYRRYFEALQASLAANFTVIALDALFGLARYAGEHDHEQAHYLLDYVARHPASSAETRRSARAMLQDIGEVEQQYAEDGALAPIEEVVQRIKP